jgi:AraC-like DNA-binding protein
MKKIINIALSFSEDQADGLCPVVTSVHVYPLRRGHIGNFSCQTSWALEYHSKDAGFIELRNDPGKWRKRRADSVHIYGPECFYREDTQKADLPLEENYFIFTGGEVCGFTDLLDSGLLFAVLHDPEGKVGHLMRKAGELCEIGGMRAFWKVQALFMEIIQLLMSARNKSKGSWTLDCVDKEFEPGFADEVEQYLRKNIAQNVKTSEIARYMKVSESSLNHKFKDKTGTSPINRLIEIRMDFAKSLLLKGEKLKNIADMIGFYDEYHLSKTFKKQLGISPRAFKAGEGNA